MPPLPWWAPVLPLLPYVGAFGGGFAIGFGVGYVAPPLSPAPLPAPGPIPWSEPPGPPRGPGDEGACGPASGITTCMELEEEWNYGYSSPEDALCEFPAGSHKKQKKGRPTTSGPCVEVGEHYTVGPGRQGSIVCCPCCEGPALEMRCGTQ